MKKEYSLMKITSKFGGSIIYMLMLLCVFFTFSCNNKKKNKVKEDFIAIESEPIKIPLSKMERLYSDNDTIHYCNQKSKYKLIHFIDSTKCSVCAIDIFFHWNHFINADYNKRVDFIFIVEPNMEHIDDIVFAIQSCGLQRPVFVDKKKQFRLFNPQIANRPQYDCFLLDSNNKVIFIGNPLIFKNIQEQYIKIVSNKTNKR